MLGFAHFIRRSNVRPGGRLHGILSGRRFLVAFVSFLARCLGRLRPLAEHAACSPAGTWCCRSSGLLFGVAQTLLLQTPHQFRAHADRDALSTSHRPAWRGAYEFLLNLFAAPDSHTPNLVKEHFANAVSCGHQLASHRAQPVHGFPGPMPAPRLLQRSSAMPKSQPAPALKPMHRRQNNLGGRALNFQCLPALLMQ